MPDDRTNDTKDERGGSASGSDRTQHGAGGSSDSGGGNATQKVKEEAATHARDLGEKAGSRAKDATEHIRESARERVQRGQGAAAEKVGGVAQALHDASSGFREQGLGFAADQGERFASRIDEARDYLEQRDPEELLDDTRRFAREHPAVFLGGMFVAGLVVARFMQSSSGGGGDRYRSGRDDGGMG